MTNPFEPELTEQDEIPDYFPVWHAGTHFLTLYAVYGWQWEGKGLHPESVHNAGVSVLTEVFKDLLGKDDLHLHNLTLQGIARQVMSERFPVLYGEAQQQAKYKEEYEGDNWALNPPSVHKALVNLLVEVYENPHRYTYRRVPDTPDQ